MKAIGLVLVLTLAGCGLAPGAPSASELEPVCAVQSLSCYHFAGTLRVGSASMEVEGWSQDLPTPGFENRWHYILSAPAAAMLAPYGRMTSAWHGGAAVVWPGGGGGMYQEALTGPGGVRLWYLGMRPTDPGVAQAFAALAGAQEYRAQAFRAEARADGGAEILIEEPKS